MTGAPEELSVTIPRHDYGKGGGDKNEMNRALGHICAHTG